MPSDRRASKRDEPTAQAEKWPSADSYPPNYRPSYQPGTYSYAFYNQSGGDKDHKDYLKGMDDWDYRAGTWRQSANRGPSPPPRYNFFPDAPRSRYNFTRSASPPRCACPPRQVEAAHAAPTYGPRIRHEPRTRHASSPRRGPPAHESTLSRYAPPSRHDTSQAPRNREPYGYEQHSTFSRNAYGGVSRSLAHDHRYSYRCEDYRESYGPFYKHRTHTNTPYGTVSRQFAFDHITGARYESISLYR